MTIEELERAPMLKQQEADRTTTYVQETAKGKAPDEAELHGVDQQIQATQRQLARARTDLVEKEAAQHTAAASGGDLVAAIEAATRAASLVAQLEAFLKSLGEAKEALAAKLVRPRAQHAAAVEQQKRAICGHRRAEYELALYEVRLMVQKAIHKAEPQRLAYEEARREAGGDAKPIDIYGLILGPELPHEKAKDPIKVRTIVNLKIANGVVAPIGSELEIDRGEFDPGVHIMASDWLDSSVAAEQAARAEQERLASETAASRARHAAERAALAAERELVAEAMRQRRQDR